MRIRGEKLPSSPLSALNLFWYFTLESETHTLAAARMTNGTYTRYFRGDFGELGQYDIVRCLVVF
jgi:hypothetical protein